MPCYFCGPVLYVKWLTYCLLLFFGYLSCLATLPWLFPSLSTSIWSSWSPTMNLFSFMNTESISWPSSLKYVFAPAFLMIIVSVYRASAIILKKFMAGWKNLRSPDSLILGLSESNYTLTSLHFVKCYQSCDFLSVINSTTAYDFTRTATSILVCFSMKSVKFSLIFITDSLNPDTRTSFVCFEMSINTFLWGVLNVFCSLLRKHFQCGIASMFWSSTMRLLNVRPVFRLFSASPNACYVVLIKITSSFSRM